MDGELLKDLPRFWRPHALVARAELARRDGDPAKSAALFLAAVSDAGAGRFDLVYPSFVTLTADGLASSHPGTARALVDQALLRPDAMERWYTPALLLSRGKLALDGQGEGAAAAAEADFRAALNQAQAQSAWLLHAQAAAALAALPHSPARPGQPARARSRPRR